MSDYLQNIIILWPASYTVRAYCVCGDALRINAHDIEAVEEGLMAFRSKHDGEGHQPCDAHICLIARRKRETGLGGEA